MDLPELLFAILLISCLVQIVYVLGIFQRLLFHKENRDNSTSPTSIVVAARNEAQNLPGLLEALLTQDHPNFEVIIVDDRSEDETRSILEQYQLTHPNLRIISIDALPEGWNGKKHALKRGIEAAKHEIVLLTDADCIPDSDQWIQRMTKNFDPQTTFVLGFSRYQELPGFLNHLIRFETMLAALQYLSFVKAGMVYMGVGRNLAYRKSIFRQFQFKGIEHLTGGDDDLFVNRFGNGTNTKIEVHPESVTTSKPKLTWASYFKQKIRHLSAGKHYQKKERTTLGIFALSNWSGWIVFFWLLFLGGNPLIILPLFGLRSILFYIIFTRAGRKLGVRLLPLTLPLMDLFYNLFYMVVGLRALTAKRIKWS